MREELAELDDARYTFTGKFERLGTKRGYYGETEYTLLLVEIKGPDGKILTDHLWFNLTQGFEAILPQVQYHSVIQFVARPDVYMKGYLDGVMDFRSWDWKLSRPTKIRVLSGGRTYVPFTAQQPPDANKKTGE